MFLIGCFLSVQVCLQLREGLAITGIAGVIFLNLGNEIGTLLLFLGSGKIALQLLERLAGTIIVGIVGLDLINEVLLLLLGFIDGRAEMYVDIALSYAVLGFISSLIVARYLEGKEK